MGSVDLLRSKRGAGYSEAPTESRTITLTDDEMGSYQDGEECRMEVAGKIQGNQFVIESLKPMQDAAPDDSGGLPPIVRTAVTQSPS